MERSWLGGHSELLSWHGDLLRCAARSSIVHQVMSLDGQ
jgi:hypothetical protein